MDEEDQFQIRSGHIRSRSLQRQRPFIAQALAAAQKAGSNLRRSRKGRGQTFGRGRRATLIANRLLTNRSRLCVIKARVVRHRNNPAPLQAHLRYLQREGVMRDGEKAVLFGKDSDAIDREAFAEICAEDRHHFRFIVSPEDAYQLSDLRQFTRDLMEQAAADLGTKLDWVGVTHWNTEHPHVHVILRGRTDLDEDLVISRDYIREGMRARAQGFITEELGPRTDNEIHQALSRQVGSERFTQLDRQLLREAERYGFVDVAHVTDRLADQFQVLKAGRVRKLEALGLADQFAPGQWLISGDAEATLRNLGERGDIIKRIHRALGESHIERNSDHYDWSNADIAIIGRLLDRGLDDELRGTAFAIIDGLDGRTHHLLLPSIEACSDAPKGAIVGVSGRREKGEADYMTVHSDLDLEAQIRATGSTWLDRQAVEGTGAQHTKAGFGVEVSQALDKRIEHLTQTGLIAHRGVPYSQDLLATLKARELAEAGRDVWAKYNRPIAVPSSGDAVSGLYRERRDLASGRFAILDDGAGLQIVPWSPKLEAHAGEWVTGTMGGNGRVTWDIARQRGVGLDR